MTQPLSLLPRKLFTLPCSLIIPSSCTSEMAVLRPDTPAVPVDSSYSWTFDDPQLISVFWANSTIANEGQPYTWRYVMSANLSQPFTLRPADLCMGHEETVRTMLMSQQFTYFQCSSQSGTPRCSMKIAHSQASLESLHTTTAPSSSHLADIQAGRAKAHSARSPTTTSPLPPCCRADGSSTASCIRWFQLAALASKD